MEKDLISVIVPVYNVAEFLPYSLESIINQKYQNLEIIIVNDGSTDKSLEICNEYAKKDSRIKIINQTNKGLSSARNAGLEIATGKYIGFIDSDDIISSEFFEYLYKIIIDTNSDIAECAFVKIGEEDVFLRKYKFDTNNAKKYPNVIVDSEGALNRLHNEDVNITVKTVVVWNKLYKKCLFDNIRFPEGKRYEDDFTTYKMLREIQKMVSTDRVLYNYVQREKSIMHQKFSIKRLDALEVFDNYIKEFKLHSDQYLFDKCLVRYLRVLTTILEELQNSDYNEKEIIINIIKEKYKETVSILEKHKNNLILFKKEFIENSIKIYNKKFEQALKEE